MFGAHTISNCNKIAFSSCAKIVKKQLTVSADKISSNLLFVITREKIISFFVWKNMKIQYLFSAFQYPPMKIWQQLGHRHLLWTSWKIPINWNKSKWRVFLSIFREINLKTGNGNGDLLVQLSSDPNRPNYDGPWYQSRHEKHYRLSIGNKLQIHYPYLQYNNSFLKMTTELVLHFWGIFLTYNKQAIPDPGTWHWQWT